MLLRAFSVLSYLFLDVRGSKASSTQGSMPSAPDGNAFPDMGCTLGEGFMGRFGTTHFPRSQFGGRSGVTATGWPSKGGFYSHYCSVVELEFLGLDRFEPLEKSQDPEEEELHCAKMRQLGARWFRDDEEMMRLNANDRRNSPRLFVGWPATGGVWALETTRFDAADRGLGRIGNALTMEERCKMIEQFGGSFYADPKDCPYLDLDGVREGKQRL